MTRNETKKILQTITSVYPNFKSASMVDTVDAWQEVLDDIPYEAVRLGVKNYIRTSNSGYAPTIGQILEQVRKLVQTTMTETEAWALVIKAVRNSAYHSKEEFEKLPRQIQSAIGSPQVLKDMAVSENFNDSVESSNFMRSFRTAATRETERSLVAPEAREMLMQNQLVLGVEVE